MNQLRRPEVTVETQLAGVEEAREDALEVAQEADATPEARAEVAEAVRPPGVRSQREKTTYTPGDSAESRGRRLTR